ncbi:MAG: hypothetical protein KIT46_08350 [Anaerolineales bacterium]|nr:hypothetical protein [Anaerolineales bacterium]MCW5856041.1 hypothetical protein [Anaerolineales bacterium]
MNTAELTAALQARMAARGAQPLPPAGPPLPLHFASPQGEWWLALAAQQADADACQQAFEAGLQSLLALASQSAAQLVLAVSFASTTAGQTPSYRPALKKYSNSVIFEDLGIHLWLASQAEWIELQPTQVSPFLRDLNRWIASHKAA